MDFEITKMDIPSIPEFNFEELKKDLQEKTTKYENIIYNDNEIAQAKKDRADLNKLKKAINDKRIAMEKEYMQPFNEFKNKVKEILDILEKPIASIDSQVKNYETQVAAAKKAYIEEYFKTSSPYEWLKLEQVFNQKWLNSSTSKKSIEDDLQLTYNMIESELKSLDTLDYKDEALETYKKTLSMNAVLSRVADLKELDKALAEQKAKIEAKGAVQEVHVDKPVEAPVEAPVEEKAESTEEAREWMDMQIYLNSADFDKFEAWTKENNIEWRLKL